MSMGGFDSSMCSRLVWLEISKPRGFKGFRRGKNKSTSC
jgi:hypothetical protein